MNRQDNNKSLSLGDVTYVKRVHVGSINPNSPVSEEQQEKQMELLNRCLNDYPRGRIIGKDVTTGLFQVGDHQISMQRITYHVGFSRKPIWLTDNKIF